MLGVSSFAPDRDDTTNLSHDRPFGVEGQCLWYFRYACISLPTLLFMLKSIANVVEVE